MADRTSATDPSVDPVEALLLGRQGGVGPTAALGACLARDGSTGAPVALDLDRPHAGLVVGKRGYGKSYTLGVLAEALARADGAVPVVVDPMGAFEGLGAAQGIEVVRSPRVRGAALPPRAWCDLLDLPPTGATGALLWTAAAEADALEGIRDVVESATAERAARRAVLNHLGLARSWDVFARDGLRPASIDAATVLDCSRLADAPTNAVVRAVAAGCYEARLQGEMGALPWLLVDEAHVLFDGVAGPALETLLTRGRAPGASVVLATQRPGALPGVAVSQADLLVGHRLTAEADIQALAAARPTYASAPIADRLPERPGEAVVVDDATEAVHVVRVRDRRTPHGGASPPASGRDDGGEESSS